MRAHALLLPLPGDTAWGRQRAGKSPQPTRTRVQCRGMAKGRPCSPCHHGYASPGCQGRQQRLAASPADLLSGPGSLILNTC